MDRTICLTKFFATVQNLFEQDVKRPKVSYWFLSILKGKEGNFAQAPVHLSGGGKIAINDGDWKMIERLGYGGFTELKFPKSMTGEPEGQLYSMKTDRQEKNNLYFSEP